GVATTAHAVPFQCSASGWSLPREFSADPTAHTSLAVMLATAFSWLLPGEAFGLVTRLQGAVCASAAGASSTSAATAAAGAVSGGVVETLMLFPLFFCWGGRAGLPAVPARAGRCSRLAWCFVRSLRRASGLPAAAATLTFPVTTTVDRGATSGN